MSDPESDETKTNELTYLFLRPLILMFVTKQLDHNTIFFDFLVGSDAETARRQRIQDDVFACSLALRAISSTYLLHC